MGYLAGVEIASPQLFEALDAHGHPLHAPSLTCGTCRLALEEGGFCAEHRMGFVHGLAYLSPLTYQLARAKLVDPDSITCPTCRAAMQTIGWCDEHGVGMVGERRVIHKADYEMLAEAYRQLVAAVEKSAECETCAAAMVADGYCPEHRIHYSGGRAKAP